MALGEFLNAGDKAGAIPATPLRQVSASATLQVKVDCRDAPTDMSGVSQEESITAPNCGPRSELDHCMSGVFYGRSRRTRQYKGMQSDNNQAQFSDRVLRLGRDPI